MIIELGKRYFTRNRDVAECVSTVDDSYPFVVELVNPSGMGVAWDRYTVNKDGLELSFMLSKGDLVEECPTPMPNGDTIVCLSCRSHTMIVELSEDDWVVRCSVCGQQII